MDLHDRLGLTPEAFESFRARSSAMLERLTLGGVATADEMAETLGISPEQVHLYGSRGYAVAVGWQPLESGRAAVDFRRVAAIAARRRPARRESHRGRPGHRRTTSARAGPSDDPGPGEPPGPALRLARPSKALYCFAASHCPTCGAVLLWSDGRLVCASRSCPRWGKPA
jgi:hypothetical protein